jgi:hypothetical protein
MKWKRGESNPDLDDYQPAALALSLCELCARGSGETSPDLSDKRGGPILARRTQTASVGSAWPSITQASHALRYRCHTFSRYMSTAAEIHYVYCRLTAGLPTQGAEGRARMRFTYPTALSGANTCLLLEVGGI